MTVFGNAPLPDDWKRTLGRCRFHEAAEGLKRVPDFLARIGVPDELANALERFTNQPSFASACALIESSPEFALPIWKYLESHCSETAPITNQELIRRPIRSDLDPSAPAFRVRRRSVATRGGCLIGVLASFASMLLAEELDVAWWLLPIVGFAVGFATMMLVSRMDRRPPSA